MQSFASQSTTHQATHRGTTRQRTDRRPAEPKQIVTRTRAATIKKRLSKNAENANAAIVGHVMRPHPAIVAAVVMKSISEANKHLFEATDTRNAFGNAERAARIETQKGDVMKFKPLPRWSSKITELLTHPMVRTATTLEVVETIIATLTESDKIVCLEKNTNTLRRLLQEGNIDNFTDCFCGKNAMQSRQKQDDARRQDFLTESPAFAK